MKKTKSFQKKPTKLTGQEREGLLVAHYGISADIEDETGKIIRCHLRKNLEPVITGDHVFWLPEPGSSDSGVVVGFQARKTLLSRPEGKSKIKPLAANIDALIIVTAPQALFEHLLDRFLVAAEHLTIPPLILFNKSDLLDEETRKATEERLALYQSIGYDTMLSNTVTPEGIAALNHFLAHKNCVLVGASGVGKSSIIAATTHEAVRVGETSAKGQGKHTTTMTRLYHLPEGGSIIDSPGVREFGLWHLSPEEILHGFKEFQPFLKNCKYRNCDHLTDPSCGLIQALNAGQLSEKRLASYRELLNLSP